MDFKFRSIVTNNMINDVTSLTLPCFRFGEVYHGKWQGTDVAVKKFHSWDDASWKREYMVDN